MYCSRCGRQLEADARFCAGCGVAIGGETERTRRVLVRPREGRLIAGVCAAFSDAYRWDISLVRVVATLLLCVSAGIAALVYFALWVLLPEAQFALPREAGTGTIA